MNSTNSKIKEGIRNLATQPSAIVSGTVAGIDESARTIDVVPNDGGAPIKNVMLLSVFQSSKGVCLFPKDGSAVIIGAVDGPGDWVLLKAEEITKCNIVVGNVSIEMDDTKVDILSGMNKLEIGNTTFKMNTASDGLFLLLSDLISTLSAATVGSVPFDGTVLSALTLIQTRLSNLLSN